MINVHELAALFFALYTVYAPVNKVRTHYTTDDGPTRAETHLVMVYVFPAPTLSPRRLINKFSLARTHKAYISAAQTSSP
jgi:hypothetical protein